MFDPSSKHNRNRSLLSPRGEGDKAARGESLLSRAPSQPEPASETPPAAEPRARDDLHSLTGRAKERYDAGSKEGQDTDVEADQARFEADARATRAQSRSFHEDQEAREPQRLRAYPQPADEDAYWRPIIDPMRVFWSVVDSKWLILATTVLGAIAGVLIALATPKEYYSATEILFDPRSLQLSDRDLTRDSLPSDATLALIENQIGIIGSSTVLNRVVEELDLADDPEFNGQGGSILGTLMNPRALLSFGGDGPASDERQTAIAVQNLAEKLDVYRNERTFIIHIGVLTQDPDKSALVANTVVDVYLQQSGALQRQTAERATGELTDQLDELKAAVEAAERAVVDYKAENDIFDAQGRLLSDDEIVQLNEQLARARARTAELNARAATANDLDVDSVLGGALPEQVASPVMAELLSQYTSLSQQADRAATRLGPRHPDNQTVQAELEGLRGAIANELRRVNASMQVELQRAVELEQELAARLARMKADKVGRENEYVRLRELEREAEARRAVYESFLLRARQTGQQSGLNTSNTSIISTAYPPLLPSGPSRSSVAIAGTVLGFLAGIAIAAGRGVFESLRENTGGGGRPARYPGEPPAARRRDDEDENFADDDDGFDPPPPGPGGGRPSRYRSPYADAGDASVPQPDRKSGRRLTDSASGPEASANETPFTVSSAYDEPVHATQIHGHHPVQPAFAAQYHPDYAAGAPYPAHEAPAASPYSPFAYSSFPPAPSAGDPAPARPVPAASSRQANDDLPFAHGEGNQPSPLDRICEDLRTFRREVDDLAERRARRRA